MGEKQSSEKQGIGDKLLQELRSTVGLMFKQVGEHTVSVDLTQQARALSPKIPCKPYGVAFVKEEPQLHNALTDYPFHTRLGRCPIRVALPPALRHPCHWKPAIHYETFFSVDALACHRVTFQNMACKVEGWSPTRFRITRYDTAPKKLAAKLLEVPPPRVVTMLDRVRRLKTQSPEVYRIPKIKTQVGSTLKLFARIPWVKEPTPLHRFSTVIKNVFREALAEKGKTVVKNVRIFRVYDRLLPGLFSSIQQGDKGILSCLPKKELLMTGRKDKSTTVEQASYLVVGNRLDNDVAIQVFVPVSRVQAALDQTPSS